MKEETVRSQFVSTARSILPSFQFMRHEDKFKHGVPDLSVTGRRFTSWWEFKLADPDFQSEGIQELTMKRLDAAGFARYIIYEKDPKQIFIVRPDDLRDWKTLGICYVGWDHTWVLRYMWDVHSKFWEKCSAICL